MRDGARIDDVDVGRAVEWNGGEAKLPKLIRQEIGLGLIDLAAQRVQGNPGLAA